MNEERVLIRRAELTDLGKVEAVARATWPVAYAGIIPHEVQRRLLARGGFRGNFGCAGLPQGRRLLVAEAGGGDLGFRQFLRPAAGAGELSRIAVPPVRQRSGIGRRLRRPGLTEFAAEGLKHLTVEFEHDNVQGRRFYELYGFAEPREVTRDVQGYALGLVEYRRSI